MPLASALAAHAADEVLRALLNDVTRFLDGETVGRRLLGTASPAARPHADAARRAGRIIGAWDGSEFRYPAFQFDGRGQPLARLPDLLAVLSDVRSDGGRDAVLWLFAPDAALGGRSPADAFPHEPDRVVALRQHRLDDIGGSE